MGMVAKAVIEAALNGLRDVISKKKLIATPTPMVIRFALSSLLRMNEFDLI